MSEIYIHPGRGLTAAERADWHPADIVAALRKRGTSLRQLSLRAGYREGTIKSALRRPWPKAERLIARALGVAPHAIWPSRYDHKGRPNRVIGRPRNDTPDRDMRNVKLTGAA